MYCTVYIPYHNTLSYCFIQTCETYKIPVRIYRDKVPLCSPFLELQSVSSANLLNARKAVHEVAHGGSLHVKETTAENLEEETRLEGAR